MTTHRHRFELDGALSFRVEAGSRAGAALRRRPRVPESAGRLAQALAVGRAWKPIQRLPGEHGALAVLAKLVSAERAVASQHVVAGDQPRDGVGADGLAHGPGGAGKPHGAGESRIGGGPGGAELEQRLPDLELKVRALHRELQGRGGIRGRAPDARRSEEHTSELQSPMYL